MCTARNEQNELSSNSNSTHNLASEPCIACTFNSCLSCHPATGWHRPCKLVCMLHVRVQAARTACLQAFWKMHTSRVCGDLACRKPHGARRLCTREMRSPTVIAAWKQEDEVQWVVRSIDLVDFVTATIAHAQQHAPTLRALIVVHSNFVERAPLPVGAVRSCINSRSLTITTAQQSALSQGRVHDRVAVPGSKLCTNAAKHTPRFRWRTSLQARPHRPQRKSRQPL